MRLWLARCLSTVLGGFFVVALCPLVALADDSLAAGFAPGPLWLSTSAPTDGEKVHLYTVVYDSSPTPLEGSVTFMVDGVSIGTAPFSLEAGATSIKSVDWVAAIGNHSVSASVTSALNKSSKQPAVIASASASAVSIMVAPAPPKPAAFQALDTVSTSLVTAAPLIASATQGVVATAENIRKSGEQYLQNQLLDTSGTITPSDASAPAGSVLGAETYRAPVPATNAAPASGIKQTIAHALLPIFRYPALFYPVFFVLLLILFFIISRSLRNPDH